MTPIRLTVVLTHPIQYYAPWFRHIAKHARGLALTVVHATEPTPEQQGVGFGLPLAWDVPLTDGYESVTVRPPREGERIDSEHFFGLDVPEIGDAMAKTRPDVVLIAGWYSITLVRALFAGRRLGIPVLYRGDSHLLSGPRGWRRLPWLAKTWLLLKQFDGFLSPGVRVSQYLRWFGASDSSIFDVPHGIDNDRFAETAAVYQEQSCRRAARADWGLAPDAFVVLFVGKLVPFKRPLDLVRAVARLQAPASLVVAGAGPLEEAVRSEASRLRVDVKMTGFLNQTELGRAYAIADCLTLPSDFRETWGLVVNEALATGLPCVVSSAVGCAPDLVRDGETGYLYPFDRVDTCADRLETIRQRKQDGYNWAPACRALAGRFSFPVMTAGLVDACRAAVGRVAAPVPAPRM